MGLNIVELTFLYSTFTNGFLFLSLFCF